MEVRSCYSFPRQPLICYPQSKDKFLSTAALHRFGFCIVILYVFSRPKSLSRYMLRYSRHDAAGLRSVPAQNEQISYPHSTQLRRCVRESSRLQDVIKNSLFRNPESAAEKSLLGCKTRKPLNGSLKFDIGVEGNHTTSDSL